MAKDKITDYDATAANNLDVGGISVAEGMLPSGVNNAMRELMSHQKEAFGSGTPLYVDQVNNRVGINQAAPAHPVHVGTDDLIVDTSGNLLVGKTATGLANQGAEFSSTGQVKGTAPNQVVGYFNRTSSDGEILQFRKDNTTVGSIGNRDADDIFINTAGGTGSLSVGGTEYYAWSSGAIYPWTDNARNLGGASVRWQDLYLSGGVYVGGTGSANYLDDYEEGTWTPTIVAGATSLSVSQAKYTKVGRLVTAQLYATSISGTNAAGLAVSLPFSVDGYYTALDDPNFGNHHEVRTEHGTSYVNLFDIDGSRTQTTGNSYGASRHMIWSITYTTT